MRTFNIEKSLLLPLWILQYIKGYSPFVNKMSFEICISGDNND